MKKVFYVLSLMMVVLCASCGSNGSSGKDSNQENSTSNEVTNQDNSSSNEGANKMFASVETAKNGLTDVGFISSDGECMVIFLDGNFAEVDLKKDGEWDEAFKCDISISMNSNGDVVANLIGYGEFTPEKLSLKDGTSFSNFKMYSFQELRDQGINVN